jgi:hypothetical protein
MSCGTFKRNCSPEQAAVILTEHTRTHYGQTVWSGWRVDSVYCSHHAGGAATHRLRDDVRHPRYQRGDLLGKRTVRARMNRA